MMQTLPRATNGVCRLRSQSASTASTSLKASPVLGKARCFTSNRGLRLSQQIRTDAAAQIVKVTAEELQKELSERTQPLVIDFYATWCGPCLLLAKELEKVAEEVGDSIKILKVDTDENLELSNQLRIEGLPTMVFVGTSAQKPAIRIEGLYPAQTIVKIIKEDLFGTTEEAEVAPAASS